jgi:hypothetical protein
MTPPSLPDDVRSYIGRNLRSAEELEVLRLLERDGARSWSAGEIGAELRSSVSAAGLRLTRLQQLGFLRRSPADEQKFRFAPHSPEAHSMALKLLAAHKDFPVTVITLIFSKASPSIQDFADAFRLKKEDDLG